MVIARLGVRGMSLLNIIFLARLLNPHDYGIAALAMSMVTLLQTLSDVRVNAAVLHLRELTVAHLDVGFTLTLARGILVAAALLFGAQLFAEFSRSPALVDPLRALAIVPILDGLKNPRFVLFQRNIDFSMEFRRTLVAAVLGAIVMLTAALVLRNYWAFIASTITLRGAQSALTYYRVPSRFRISLTHWRQFASFGGWLSLAGILEHVRVGFGPNFLIGRFLGSAGLGLLSVAQTLSATVTRELSMPLQQAISPGLAAIAHDQPRLRAGFRDAQSMVFGLIFPLGVGLAAIAPDLVLLVAGPKWTAAVPLVRMLAPFYGFSLLNAGSNGLAQAMHRTRLLFERNLIISLLALPPLWVASANFGLYWAGAAIAFGILVETVLTMRMAARLVESPSFEPITTNLRTLAAALTMAAALILFGPSHETTTAQLVPALLLRVAIGLVIHCIVLFSLWRLQGKPRGFEIKVLTVLETRAPSLLPITHFIRGQRTRA